MHLKVLQQIARDMGISVEVRPIDFEKEAVRSALSYIILYHIILYVIVGIINTIIMKLVII